MKKYSATHQWVEVENGIAAIGITRHAAEQLGEITFVEIPEMNRIFQAGDCFGTVESVKTASEIFAPVKGTVCERHEELETTPEIINQDPEGRGWICKFKDIDPSALDSLMTEEEYLKSL